MAYKHNKSCLWLFFSFINAFVLFVSYTYGKEILDVFPKYSLKDVNGDYLFNDPAGKECLCKARLMAKVTCQVATILKLPNGMPGCIPPFDYASRVGCIWLSGYFATYDSAVTACHNRDSELFIVDDANGLQNVWNHLTQHHGVYFGWEILVDVKGLMWRGGRPVASYEWMSGYPLQATNNNTCVYLVYPGVLNQVQCSDVNKGFLCRRILLL
ncbi:hypothetical protein SK128_022505 [Halocaridina rubra]|uniref:C-type lectin domain-containing protein n=1 Tax=Halocaridina rubra TaxID=373956 RepID=A0AAN8XG35_HALRR